MSQGLSRTLQRTLSHLKPPPRKGGKFASPIPTHFRPKPPFVQVQDRIPFWNIAPNDKVVMVKGTQGVKGKEGTVTRVERESNRVYLKENEFAVKKRQSSQYPGESLSPSYTSPEATYFVPQPIHVSNLRLVVTDQGKTYTATRLRRSAVSWDRSHHRFHWHRYGLVPELVGTETPSGEAHSGWVKIPWPKSESSQSVAGDRDSTALESLRSSWMPTLESIQAEVDATHGGRIEAGQRAPELDLPERELSKGYHSRANRTKRWNETKALEKEHGPEVAKLIQRVQNEML